MYARKEEKTRILQKRIDNVCESLDSMERIILVFKKLLSVVPKHYYVVDRMVFSDRSKITAMKIEMNKSLILILQRAGTYLTMIWKWRLRKMRKGDFCVRYI